MLQDIEEGWLTLKLDGLQEGFIEVMCELGCEVWWSWPELSVRGLLWGKEKPCRGPANSSSQLLSLAWSPVMREVQERWVWALSLRAMDTVLMNMKPVPDKEPVQGFKQRSVMIFLKPKSDRFMTMLRMYGRVRKLEAVRRPELRQWQMHLGWVYLRGM